jgi:PPM family protein phosphatase
VRLAFAAVTDPGRVRQNNEDSVLAEETLFVVADGLGGHAAGEVASQLAIEAMRASFARDQSPDGLVRSVHDANAAVWERAHDDAELRGMSTTVTAAAPVERDGDAVIEMVNVGDSRGYLLRDGELEQVTEDHSLVEEMVRSGQLSPEEAANHPRKNIVTRALGMEDRGEVAPVDVDSFTILPYRGDRILLASDGLTNEVSDEKIASVLRRLADPDDAARELVRLANANGGNDNISVVIVDVVDDDGKAEAASEALAGEPAPPPVADDASVRISDAPSSADPDRSPPTRPVQRVRRQRTSPRLTLRSAAFVGAVVLVLFLAVAAITWYARGSYYVGVRSGNVTIFQGRPGGFLWVKPTVVDRTDLRLDEVPPARQPHVREGQPEPTLRAARRYIANLRDEAAALVPTPTTVDPTATTAAPPPTTVVP